MKMLFLRRLYSNRFEGIAAQPKNTFFQTSRAPYSLHAMTTTNFLPPHFLRARLRGLYVITDERLSDPETSARAALQGGAKIIQLRDKTHSTAQLLPLAHRMRQQAHAFGAAFIVNDRVDIALACQADGVHLGPDDLPVEAARLLLGPHKIIGASCGSMEEARQAEISGASYIGAGAVFGTLTKADAGEAIGLETLRAIASATRLPVAAIGGININNVRSVIEAGAQMACVVSAVVGAGDAAQMQAATRLLIEAASFEDAS